MKKKFLLVVVLFFLCSFFGTVNGQDPHCADIKADLEKAERLEAQLSKDKIALDYAMSLMDDAVPDISGLTEEITKTENKIKALQAKIAGGDKSAESATELQSLRNRDDLLRMRMSKDFNKSTYYSQPKYKELTKEMSNLKDMEFDNKRDIADLESRQKAYNCPTIAKKEMGDIEISTELGEGSWSGRWVSADPRHPEMKIHMVLNGSGNSLSGTTTLETGGGLKTEYHIKDCNESGANKLGCAFTATMEDNEKYMDVKGTVEMTMAGNTLNSSWKEVGSPGVRWKPGHERNVQLRPPISFAIPFTRE